MEEELQETTELPDFNEIKGIIRRRRWQFLLPFFCGWALVWGASWLIHSTYRSETVILVEQPSVPEKYVVSNIDSDIQHQLDSITQQILSRTRLLRIIDSLGLYPQERKHVSPDDLVEKMRKDIEIELSPATTGNSRPSTFITPAAIRRWHSGRPANWRIFLLRKISRSVSSVQRIRPTSFGPSRTGPSQAGGAGSEIKSLQRSASRRVAHPDAEQSADSYRSSSPAAMRIKMR